MISYLQAIVFGILQGVTEMFPISSLGHSVLLPSVLGWKSLTTLQQQKSNSFLTFLVALHVATALSLFWYYRRDWIRVIRGFIRSIKKRRIATPSERLAWLLIVGTIPAGLVGLLFEHELRNLFAKPLTSAIFLTLNGAVLLAGEAYRRKRSTDSWLALPTPGHQLRRDKPPFLNKHATGVGIAQILALFAGFSRSGVTMVAGLVEGLDHEDAARYSFMLATPIIFAAGVLKLPHLFSHSMSNLHGQILVGVIATAISTLLSVHFLVKWFKTRTLTPFALYCIAAGVALTIRFA